MTKFQNRIDFTNKNNPRNVWPRATRFYETEMMPLLGYIISNSGFQFVQLSNKTFKKYLIISCVSLIDYYMTLQVRKYVDEQNIDLSKLDPKYRNKFEKRPDITKGQSIIGQTDFTSTYNINEIATAILGQDDKFNNLNMKFFDAVKKIDWYDPYRYIRGFDNDEIIEAVKPLTENWNNFIEMFRLRHEIIHEMNEVFIPIGKLASMCDSTMNFIDATAFIFTIDHRKDVIQRLESKITLRERNARIDKAMDIAIAKGKIPPEYDIQAYYKHRGFDQDGKPV